MEKQRMVLDLIKETINTSMTLSIFIGVVFVLNAILLLIGNTPILNIVAILCAVGAFVTLVFKTKLDKIKDQ